MDSGEDPVARHGGEGGEGLASRPCGRSAARARGFKLREREGVKGPVSGKWGPGWLVAEAR